MEEEGEREEERKVEGGRSALTWAGTMEELPSPIRRASKPAFSIALIKSSLVALPACPDVGEGQKSACTQKAQGARLFSWHAAPHGSPGGGDLAVSLDSLSSQVHLHPRNCFS